jgi:hypothetical protein
MSKPSNKLNMGHQPKLDESTLHGMETPGERKYANKSMQPIRHHHGRSAPSGRRGGGLSEISKG